MNDLELAIHRHRLEGIAGEMGQVLKRTAFSPNIREREDLSCAITDPEGNLVAQAAHIPVHLGAVPEIMDDLLSEVNPEPGRGYLTNDPYCGGTHLPDITYARPCYRDGELVGWVVNRAHHTDVGGDVAGSMALSTHIDQEGVRIRPRPVSEHGTLLPDSVRDLLEATRTPEMRRTDLEAQVAAAERGAQRLRAWSRSVEPNASVVFNDLRQYGRRFMSRLISEFGHGTTTAELEMDGDGCGREFLPLRVTVHVEDEHLELDFRDNSDQVTGNINCPRSVTVSACFYVLRCLVEDDVPVNQGILDPVTVRTRAGTVLEAEPPAPVAAGNVETSQQIVDLLFRAFGELLPGRIPAASQGTMNNVTFGWTAPGGEGTYYETLGGGAGGGPEHPGVSCRQVHMTNTRNTPIEDFERSAPLLVTRLQRRTGSGGDGERRGGDGLIKRWRSRSTVQTGLITERRRTRPYGLQGGEPGQAGENRLRRSDEDDFRVLPGKTTLTLEDGDELELRTPGGGGHG